MLLGKKYLGFFLGSLFVISCNKRVYNEGESKEFVKADFKTGQPISFPLLKTMEALGLKPTQIKVTKKELKGFQTHAPDNVKFNLEVVFIVESQEQFQKLMKHYGGWAKVPSSITYRGVGEYRLEEFLPPAIQATYGHRFDIQKQKAFYLTLEDAKQAPAGSIIPDIIQFMSNCWTTVYATMYASLNQETKYQFPIFMINADIEKVLANDKYFSRIQRIQSGSDKIKSIEKSLNAGDIVNIYGQNYSTNKYSEIYHSAIKIDENLWYEKTAWASDVAYRFVSFDDILDKYPNTEFDFRKPTGLSLPHHSDIFIIAALYGQKGKNYPSIFKYFISESPYPSPTGAEGYGIKNVTLIPGDGKKIAQLPAQAFNEPTFTLPGEAKRPIDFSDLKGTGIGPLDEDPYAFEIREAALRGIVSGFPDGSFQPQGPVTRAQMVVLVLNALSRLEGISLAIPTEVTQIPFTDVEKNHWAASHIVYAQKIGLVKGKTETTFDPNGSVTKAEVAAIFKKAVEYVRGQRKLTGPIPSIMVPDAVRPNDIENHWAKEVITQMYQYCWSASVNLAGRDGMAGFFRPDNPATRNYAAASTLRLYHCLTRDQ